MSSTTPEPDDVSPEEPPLGSGIDFTDPNSPLAPYYLRASHVVAAVLLAAVVALYSLLPLWHSDIWGHMAFGRWMSQSGQLPEREPFTPFADKESEYINFQWLAQLGFYQVYHAGEWLAGGDETRRTEGGVAFLRLLTVLLAFLYYCLLLFAYRGRSGSLPLACAGILVGLLLARMPFAFLRPQVFGQVLFAALLLLLARPTPSRRILITMPLLLVLWANLHGSFPIGFVLVGLTLAGRIVEALASNDPAKARGFWREETIRRLFFALLLAVIATAFSNPHGPRLFLHVLEMGSNLNVSTMDEWHPLLSQKLGAVLFYFLSVAVLLAAYVLGRSWPTMSELFLMLFFGLYPFLQGRMTIWWMPLVPWLMMRPLAVWRERSQQGWLHQESILSFRKTLMVAALVFITLPWTPPLRWLLGGKPAPLRTAVSPATPWELAVVLKDSASTPVPWLERLNKALQEHYPNGRFTGRIFASETAGEYLIWSLPEAWPVVVYTHVHLFTFRHWRDCLIVKLGDPGWEEILARQGANLVVVEEISHPHLGARLRQDPEWLIVGEQPQPTSRLLVALRKTPLPR